MLRHRFLFARGSAPRPARPRNAWPDGTSVWSDFQMHSEWSDGNASVAASIHDLTKPVEVDAIERFAAKD